LTFVLSCAVASAQNDTLSVGYGMKVSKAHSSASADAVSREQLLFTDSNNTLNSIYGLLPGVNVVQGSSLPWEDSPSITVRGTGSFNGGSTLILVDGIERDAALVNPNEVESITVLRDAAATAIYGNRGANGVILVTTKRGTEKKTKITANYTFGLMTPTNMPKMADSYQYANAVNEALANDGLDPMYTAKDLAAIKEGKTDYLPNNDWQSMIMKSTGHNNQFNLSLDGAKEKVKYFVYAEFNSWRGAFNNTELNDGYTTQIEDTELKIRSNIDARLTKTTVAHFNLMGRLNQWQYPYGGTSLTSMYTTPALSFPVMYQNKYVKSTLFSNPYQDKVGLGYSSYLERSLYADVNIDQDLRFITKGLTAQIQFTYDNSAVVYDNHNYVDSYYKMEYTRDANGDINGATYKEYGTPEGNKFGTGVFSQYMTFHFHGLVDYEKTFGKHYIKGGYIFQVMSKKANGANQIRLYQDNIVYADYHYAEKYFASLTMNASGSAKLSKGSKYRFLPAASFGWLISNEDFMKNSSISHLKLRASYGMVGSDESLAYDMDQQWNGSGSGYIFKLKGQWSGYKEGNLPSPELNPEVDRKANLGIELGWDNRFSAQLEGFYNNRNCIRVSSTGAYSSIVGIGVTDICSGRATNYGAELALGWKDKAGDFNYHINGNVAYTHSKIDYKAEEYHPYQYMYATGMPIGSFYGLTADGIYQTSDFDTDGNLKPGIPSSSYVNVQPGDVKYKDMNGDGVINDYDYSYLDAKTTPDFIFGLQLGLEYKGFGIEASFSGQTGAYTYTKLSSIYQPLYNNDKNISQWALENHWSKDNTESKYPRLTTLSNANNYANSTLWMSKLDYFKLRNLYVWYDIKCKGFDKIGLTTFRVFLRGNNLFSADTIGLFDPENISMSYPSQRNFQIGLRLAF